MMNEPGDNNGHGQCEPIDACCATVYCACDGVLCETNNDFLANDNLLGGRTPMGCCISPFRSWRSGPSSALPVQ